MPIPERDYRASRLCRILGNPTAFWILVRLGDGSHRRPTDLARELGRSIPAVSSALSALRNADLIRYDRQGRDARYWIKYPSEIGVLLNGLRRTIQRTSRRIRRDT